MRQSSVCGALERYGSLPSLGCRGGRVRREDGDEIMNKMRLSAAVGVLLLLVTAYAVRGRLFPGEVRML